MPWINAFPESQLQPGQRKVVELQGQAILFLWHDGRLHALANACPHMRFPLKGGRIVDNAIVCPFHHSAFDLETGDAKAWSPWPPFVGDLAAKLSPRRALSVFPVRVEAGQVQVDIPQVSAVL